MRTVVVGVIAVVIVVCWIGVFRTFHPNRARVQPAAPDTVWYRTPCPDTVYVRDVEITLPPTDTLYVYRRAEFDTLYLSLDIRDSTLAHRWHVIAPTQAVRFRVRGYWDK